VTNPAVKGISYHQGVIMAVLVVEDGKDKREFLKVVAADGPATKAANAVTGPVTVPAVHNFSL
jgi:hypothetical protein